jgi:hypothetical protein
MACRFETDSNKKAGIVRYRTDLGNFTIGSFLSRFEDDILVGIRTQTYDSMTRSELVAVGYACDILAYEEYNNLNVITWNLIVDRGIDFPFRKENCIIIYIGNQISNEKAKANYKIIRKENKK